MELYNQLAEERHWEIVGDNSNLNIPGESSSMRRDTPLVIEPKPKYTTRIQGVPYV